MNKVSMNIILMHQQIWYHFVDTTPQMDTNRLHTPYSLGEGLRHTLEFEFLRKDKDDVIFISE